jgi:predicted  nucleic acid-binding Zn-ribbon protein
MSLIDITGVVADAEKQIVAERTTKAKGALVNALRKLEAARQVVRNCEAEVDDLKASIADGSFT